MFCGFHILFTHVCRVVGVLQLLTYATTLVIRLHRMRKSILRDPLYGKVFKYYLCAGIMTGRRLSSLPQDWRLAGMLRMGNKCGTPTGRWCSMRLIRCRRTLDTLSSGSRPAKNIYADNRRSMHNHLRGPHTVSWYHAGPTYSYDKTTVLCFSSLFIIHIHSYWGSANILIRLLLERMFVQIRVNLNP